MKTRKILVTAGITLTVVLIIEIIKRKKVAKRMIVVADEGYETAEDILYPKKKFIRL